MFKSGTEITNGCNLDMNHQKYFSTISSQAVLVPNEFAIDHDESSGCDA